ncbi:MAG: glutamate racemase [Flavobacteriaceae bacterium]|nr:glutamate racemase [Flavobacteriaceae bacterium]
MRKEAIGIFDSGVGGTSIWKELHELLPYEDTIYLADSKNAPYGPKGRGPIRALSKKNTAYLLKRRCKLIIVACNTATTNAIHYLRNHYDVPFIGIEPAIKPAALKTKTNSVGLLATKGTLSSALFHKTANLYSSTINIIEQVGEGIVPLIENGQLHSKEMKALLNTYLQPMLNANIDHLVLGCTHYPYLIPILRTLLPKTIKIIDSGEAVAKQTKAVLEKHQLINPSTKVSKHQFYTNGAADVMQTLIGSKYKAEYLNF